MYPLAVHEGFGEDVGQGGGCRSTLYVLSPAVSQECVRSEIGKEVKRRKELALKEDR